MLPQYFKYRGGKCLEVSRCSRGYSRGRAPALLFASRSQVDSDSLPAVWSIRIRMMHRKPKIAKEYPYLLDRGPLPAGPPAGPPGPRPAVRRPSDPCYRRSRTYVFPGTGDSLVCIFRACSGVMRVIEVMMNKGRNDHREDCPESSPCFHIHTCQVVAHSFSGLPCPVFDFFEVRA